MARTTSSFDFQKVVEDMLLDYRVEVTEATFKVVPQVAKEAAKKLRSTTKIGGTGAYKASWTTKEEKGRLHSLATVYAEAPGYRLAHLLENPHPIRGGGRFNGIEHIKPVEEWAIMEAEERIVEEITGLGVT